MSKDKSKKQKPETDTISFDQIEPDQQFKTPWAPTTISGPLKALILPDIHLPYHQKQALMLSIDCGKQQGVDTVLINGDLCDFYGLSKFEKDPRARRWPDEIKLQREFLRFLRDQFPKARIIFKLGNHDERYEHYMMQRAAELVGLDTFEFANVLELEKHGVELVGDKRPMRFGQLNIIHGHEYSFAITNPVNPARGLFLRAKAYALCSHFHQKSEHSENNLECKTITTWSTGCLCDLHPAYRPLNNWSNGFAIAEIYNDNKFNLHNYKVSHGVIY